MPPFLPRRNRGQSPPAEPSPAKKKPTLFDTADTTKSTKSLKDNKKFVEALDQASDSSSLSEASSAEFEDVLPAKKVKVSHEESEDEDVEWEDALQPTAQTPTAPWDRDEEAAPLELTLDNTGVNIGQLEDKSLGKKGPSKRMKKIRYDTHCMHVQFLMWHNFCRSRWANDKVVQKILREKLDNTRKQAVDDWRRRSGIEEFKDTEKEKATPKGKLKGRGNAPPKKGQEKPDTRNQRDWGNPAARLEPGKVDLSGGDPAIRLLQTLTAWWKTNFRISSPGLRKMGYKSVTAVAGDITSFQKDPHDPEVHGEKIDGLDGFRECARQMEGSRDVGAQLFTALLRGLGLEARLVASLQPVGWGFTQAEEAHPPKQKKIESDSDSGSSSSTDEREAGGFLPEAKPTKPMPKKSTPKPTPNGKSTSKPTPNGKRKMTTKTTETQRSDKVTPKQSAKKGTVNSTRRQPGRGAKAAPIELSEDSSELSELAPSESESEESVVDVTPAKVPRKPNARYDRDMLVPNYWTEVITSASQQIIPVDATVNHKVVLKDEEKFTCFEPRGKKAEKAKQVFGYVVAFSADGSAKDVTVRYLKKHVWPGKTKGIRLPVEKIPIYGRSGKVKRYEEHDWFKMVMGPWRRHEKNRQFMDDVEDSTDLVPLKPEKKPVAEGQESLQSYKQSTEFVLERHLRREEALLPRAKSVKEFTHGKGDKEITDPVYLRKDVVPCKTAESWHKEGRQIKPGVQPLKKVPIRAVTQTRKLEIQQAERETGEKPLQGMYGKDQTEYIIPPPIENGIIPKNGYGNIDCFVPSMVPEGAVHIPYRGCVRLCKKLEIDFAEAVTGFEFGNRMAVPVIQGVVVAEENEQMVIDAYVKDQEEKERKADEKRTKVALGTWRKFLMGLRIVERVREEYGDEADEDQEEINPFVNPNRAEKGKVKGKEEDVEMMEVRDEAESSTAGGFVIEDENGGGGGFMVDEEEEE